MKAVAEAGAHAVALQRLPLRPDARIAMNSTAPVQTTFPVLVAALRGTGPDLPAIRDVAGPSAPAAMPGRIANAPLQSPPATQAWNLRLLVEHALRDAPWEWVQERTADETALLVDRISADLARDSARQGLTLSSVRIVEGWDRGVHGLFVCAWNALTAPPVFEPGPGSNAIGWDPNNPLDVPEYRQPTFDAMEAPVRRLLLTFISN